MCKDFEEKDTSVKYILSKFEYDLFDDKDNIVMPILRVKRVGVIDKSEKWKILRDNKEIVSLDGTNFSANEKKFLRTTKGFNFLIEQAKKRLIISTL